MLKLFKQYKCLVFCRLYGIEVDETCVTFLAHPARRISIGLLVPGTSEPAAVRHPSVGAKSQTV